MTTLDAFLDQCWSDHADDPAGVANRIDQALRLVTDEDGVARFAMLTHHVYGEHLARWDEGISLLDRLAAMQIDGSDGLRSLQRCRASLALCSGAGDARPTLTGGDACRTTVMAACSLASHDSGRALLLLEEATAAAATLPDDDAAVRSVASFCNNIAGTLQEHGDLSDSSRSLMLRAADLSRSHWERAGTWREVERAEYRLAVCHLAAGDGPRALKHAELCDRIVRENGSEPLEVFFASEAIALSALATGKDELFGQFLTSAEAAFAEVPLDDQDWCRPTLERLRGHPGSLTGRKSAPGAV